MLLLIFLVGFSNAQLRSPPNIGIVGGGIGGTSAAYFFREQFPDANITVYEHEKVGGRLATVTMGGHVYESGGSIIHSSNKYMVNFRKILGLKTRWRSKSGRMALYDGQNVLFESSNWFGVTMMKLFWRYGLDLWKLQSYINKLLSKFNRIYRQQDEGLAFTTPEKLLEAMGTNTSHMLHQSVKAALRDQGLNDRIINELVMSAVRVNYGQSTKVQSFVGSVGIAGVDGKLWSIHGGNKLVPEFLMEKSGARLIKGKVYQIFYDENDQGEAVYTVDADDGSHMDPIQNDYDIVVIAVPITEDDKDPIQFHNFPRPVYNRPGNFHRTVATFIKGTPNFKKFGFKSLEDFPSSLMTTKANVFFNSIGRHSPVNLVKGGDDAPVWKVFSQERLTEEQLDDLFTKREETEIVDWQAYPKYKSNEDSVPPFVMFNRLFYVNAIEWAASAMEMSVIAARNVALLALNEWTGQTGKIDQQLKNTDKKVEL